MRNVGVDGGDWEVLEEGVGIEISENVVQLGGVEGPVFHSIEGVVRLWHFVVAVGGNKIVEGHVGFGAAVVVLGSSISIASDVVEVTSENGVPSDLRGSKTLNLFDPNSIATRREVAVVDGDRGITDLIGDGGGKDTVSNSVHRGNTVTREFGGENGADTSVFGGVEKDGVVGQDTFELRGEIVGVSSDVLEADNIVGGFKVGDSSNNR